MVAIFAHLPGASSGSLCTGSIISAHAVLTAAHCVDPRVVGSGNVFEVFLGPTFSGNDTRLAVASTTFDSAFNPQNLTGGHDVGILTLARPTTLKPLPFNRAPLSTSNRSVRIVGYGTNSHANTGAGTKRTASPTIDSISARFIVIGSSSLQTCHGDSGGPAFQTINGVATIVGITSFGSDASATNVCFGGGSDTRVDGYLPFINAHL